MGVFTILSQDGEPRRGQEYKSCCPCHDFITAGSGVNAEKKWIRTEGTPGGRYFYARADVARAKYIHADLEVG